MRALYMLIFYWNKKFYHARFWSMFFGVNIVDFEIEK